MAVRIVNTEWEADRFHGLLNRQRRWRLTPIGIELQEGGYPTSRSQPRLAAEVAELFRMEIMRSLDTFGHDLGKVQEDTKVLHAACLLVATICTESAGKHTERHEPKLGDWSFGITHMLTATAHAVGHRIGWPTEVASDARRWAMPKQSVPKGGDPNAWREFLGEPYHACLLALTLHQMNDVKHDCRGDPILLTACYNAGSLKEATDPNNKWGLASTISHIDAFANFYDDAARFYLAGTGKGPP